MTKSDTKGFSKKILISLALFSVLVLCISVFFLLRTISHIRQGGGFTHPPRNPLGMFLSGERPPSAGTGSIEGWMTFDFVSSVYGLPPNYLKDTLHIEDSRYPNIPIGRYAKSIGFSKGDFVGMVQRAIDIFPKSTMTK